MVDELKIISVVNQCDMAWHTFFHNKRRFALCGFAERLGYPGIEKSGIWADNPEIPGTKKSLSPVFEYLEGMR